MARITVEDCLDQVDNRFELVLLATRRARQISKGAEPLVEVENDKPTVLALREIATGEVNARTLEQLEKKEQEIMEAEALAEATREALEGT